MRQRNHLLRVLGVIFGFAAVIGSTVGQGVLRSPGIVAQASGNEWILVGLWAAGALLAMLAALPYAELGAALPSAGGVIAFAGRAFGGGGRVAAAFALLVMQVTALSAVSFVAGELMVRLGVGGGGIGPGSLATMILAGFFLVNALGTKANGRLQIAFSAVKGLVLMALVVLLFAQPGAAPPPAPLPLAPLGWMGFATAMLVIIGAYNGWGVVVQYGEEIEDPARNLPRALFGGILGVAVLYLSVVVALNHAMNVSDLAASDFPASDAVAGVLGERGDLAFTLFSLLSISALCSLQMMTVTRIAYASARDRILPGWFEWVNGRGVPMRAMVLVSLAAAGFLWSGTYLALSSTSTALSQAILLMVALSSARLMRREPDLPRPWRIPAYWLTITVVIVFDAALLAVFVAQDPFFALLGFGMVAALSLAYRALARPKPSGPETEIA